MFVADLYLTLSYFVSFVHDYCDKLTNYRAIIQTYRAIIFNFSHLSCDNFNLSRDKFELSRDNLRKKKKDCNVPYGPPYWGPSSANESVSIKT